MSSVRTPVDVEHGLLTVLFALVAAHALWQGMRTRGVGRSGRVDHLLHGVMAATMAVMPWSPGHRLSGRTAELLFTAAALWFLLTGLDRRAAHTVAAISARLPSAVGMAAMAWMLRPSHDRDPVVTAVLTVYLLACALWSLTRPMPSLRSATWNAHRTEGADPYARTRHGAMALGTALMLLMPH
ncbi:DUF5134 domain-containing protein [Streptomyces sp. VRA16 Mangrove soil]|uniref:DUF5134 domain-containing protein n=1 Tax=Streptomyces sp. VRA16 Mangrove soil TaxID=2817434 RepID=UPI001A9FCC8B|nr:DUF5134 domain-containing protein [Streptomyces sp. VRA16 Mangrove soil]MBO1332496.1 DUF5134 domain-containing protein [Streptomyces sp. VRA16 Mangrove soil]